MLLLGEPLEEFVSRVVGKLFETFDRLREEGAMVIVEHTLDLALADGAYVLERGMVVPQGPAAALRDDLDLRRQVLWM